MRTLFTHHLLKPLLHSPIMNRTEHIRRSEMHLYRRLHHGKVNMMIPHHLIRTHLFNILHDFPATTRKIDIDVPGSTHIRVRIKQCIPLPLQDAVSKACFWAIAYSSFQSASFKESGISLAEPIQNRKKSKKIFCCFNIKLYFCTHETSHTHHIILHSSYHPPSDSLAM